MVWVNYLIDIVHKYGVELAGWPAKVAMVRPSQLRGQDVRLVVERLRNGSMRWIGLTKAQRDDVAAEVEKLRESGAAKPRRERSEKDRPRGPRMKKAAAGDADADNSDDESSTDDDGGDESEKGGASSLPPAPFGTAPSPVPPSSSLVAPSTQIPTASPIPTSASSPTPTPAIPSAGGRGPAPSPITNATSSLTSAPAVPSAGASASGVFVQHHAPAPIPSAPLLPLSYDDSLLLDFDDLDLTMGPFVSQPDASASWRLNTSNRDEGWTDPPGVNVNTPDAALGASGGTGRISGVFSGTPYAQGFPQGTNASGVTGVGASGGTGFDTGLFGVPYAQGLQQGTPYMQGLHGSPYAQGSAPGAQGNTYNAPGNPYASAPLHTQSGAHTTSAVGYVQGSAGTPAVPGASHISYPAAAGPFMSVFSASTNNAAATTTTRKKATRRAPRKTVAEGEGATGRTCASMAR
jgi:hypothetical protein